MNSKNSAVKFKGGIHVPHNKFTAVLPVRKVPTPKSVTLAMQQHIGAPCNPVVAVGDMVKIGQVIGDTDKFVSAPIHASISGKVSAIGPIELASGAVCTGITIESDGKEEVFEGIKPPEINGKDDFIKAVRASGAVGLGGAGFPTHAKLSTGDKKIDYLIVNLAECEPFITVDFREAIDHGEDIVDGARLIMKYLGIENCRIGIEDNKSQAIEYLTMLTKDDSNIEVVSFHSVYPQGAEKMIIYATTQRKVPEGGLPADVGCIVINAATTSHIARYVKTGMPLVKRNITVDGKAIDTPQNLQVPIGMRLSEIVDFCGGLNCEPEKIIFGGPMMGTAIYNLEAPICKQNNALLAFQKAIVKKERACINCGKCVDACPMSLMPTSIVKAVKRKDFAALSKLNVLSCMDCGCCTYSCPSGITIVQYTKLAKQMEKEAGSK